MHLEDITYYRNSSYPWFTPINYIFDKKTNITDLKKALILAELPAIFKKYNIRLSKTDFLLFFNPNDNIADTFDIEDVLYSIDSLDEEEKKCAMFTKEFLDLEKKIPSSKLDKLIERAINERYGFYYNKYDNNGFEKFKEYLINNIPNSGFYDVEPLTDKDFLETKLDWLDIKEQDFRNYFNFVKKVFPESKVKFLSKRFMLLYYLLSDKYSEIKVDDAILNKDGYSIRERINSIYLNDIICEESPNYFYKDYIPFLRFNKSLLNEFPSHFIPSKRSLEIYQQQINKDYFKYKKVQCRSCDEMTDLIETLEAERVILERNGIDNASSLLPKFFEDYFNFCLMYEEQIKKIKMIYNNTNDKTKAIFEMITHFGVESCPSKLISYLTSENFINHKTIEKVKIYK